MHPSLMAVRPITGITLASKHVFYSGRINIDCLSLDYTNLLDLGNRQILVAFS